jgi:hypothetical protein
MQISVQCMGVDNLWSQKLLYNKSYLMNFRRWNYNYAFYYYYLIMEKMYNNNKQRQHFTFEFTSFIAKRDATGKQIFQ